MKLDPSKTWRLVEARLAREQNPRRRRNLETVLAHMHAEADGDLDRLMATVSDAAIYHAYASDDPIFSPRGKEEVRRFYQNFVASGAHRLEFDVDRLIVDDDCILTEGTMRIAGDMVIGGKLYPSDQGVEQTAFYIYFDSSLGVGMEYMRTNAAGWSTGSYDFAEMFPSSGTLEAGDVVVFDTVSEHVRRSSTAQDAQVAGIVSTRPGFLAGDGKPGDYPIALAGRVPTKVTTENGTIEVGDPLQGIRHGGLRTRQHTRCALRPKEAPLPCRPRKPSGAQRGEAERRS